jgi:hypothetical protein
MAIFFECFPVIIACDVISDAGQGVWVSTVWPNGTSDESPKSPNITDLRVTLWTGFVGIYIFHYLPQTAILHRQKPQHFK